LLRLLGTWRRWVPYTEHGLRLRLVGYLSLTCLWFVAQIDSLFIVDPTKFISGVLCSLSAMVQMELPHINVLTKCDLVDEKELSKYVSFAVVAIASAQR
jgi:hypothetical protein